MKVHETGLFEAKTKLSELVDNVQRHGTTYVITKRGKPVAELKPLGAGRRKPVPGTAKSGPFWMAGNFNAPLDDFKDYQ